MEWEELRRRFDKLFVNQVTDDVSTEQLIDSYQGGLVHLYDRWISGNTEVSLQGDSVWSGSIQSKYNSTRPE